MKNILFIRLRLLGDIIFTIPSLEMFKKHYPDTNIYYVLEKEFQELSDIIPFVNEFIIVPRQMKLKDWWRFRQKTKSLHTDTVIDFHSGPKAALLSFISGIPIRIGYKTPNRNWAYTHLYPRKINSNISHSVATQARLLSYFGINDKDIPAYPEIHIKNGNLNPLLTNFLKLEKKIVVHIGAKKEFRDWGENNFCLLIEKLKADGWNIALIGHNESERHRGNLLETRYRVGNFIAKLKLAEILTLISESSIYVGADSGPLHLASLTKTPIIALYGPNLSQISGPWRRENIHILEKNLACRPCSQKQCKYDTMNCIRQIRVKEVYEAINSFIK